jgi:hypothetical protein
MRGRGLRHDAARGEDRRGYRGLRLAGLRAMRIRCGRATGMAISWFREWRPETTVTLKRNRPRGDGHHGVVAVA